MEKKEDKLENAAAFGQKQRLKSPSENHHVVVEEEKQRERNYSLTRDVTRPFLGQVKSSRRTSNCEVTFLFVSCALIGI